MNMLEVGKCHAKTRINEMKCLETNNNQPQIKQCALNTNYDNVVTWHLLLELPNLLPKRIHSCKHGKSPPCYQKLLLNMFIIQLDHYTRSSRMVCQVMTLLKLPAGSIPGMIPVLTYMFERYDHSP